MSIDPEIGCDGPVAVTGASGFIGQRLLMHLREDGRAAVSLSRRPSGVDGVREALLHDYSDVPSVMRALHGVDAVIHLAARAHQVWPGGNEAELFHEANVTVTQSVARACIGARVRRMVLVSSIGVNGNRTLHRPFTAGDAPNPIEPYAISKWMAEQAMAAEFRDSATDFVILRPPLVYGPDCPGNFKRLLKVVATAPLVPLGAVKAARTFIFIDNLVSALLVAASHPAASRRTFLVSDSRTLTVAVIATILAAALGRSPRIVVSIPVPWLERAARLARKPQAFEKLTAELEVDSSEFSRATGWHPAVSPEQGLRATALSYLNERLR